MRPKDFGPARKSMDLVDVEVGEDGVAATNVAVVRQAGASRAAVTSEESRNRNRREGRRKERRDDEQHIPMAACPDQVRRLTPNDHQQQHDHDHHQYRDDERRQHPAHSRRMTTPKTLRQRRQQQQQQHHHHGHRNGPWSLLPMVVAIHLLIGFAPIATEAVDCFKCSSRNGSNPACEDPFHNLNTTRVNSPILPDPQPSVIYHTPCYAGKKGREGLFPASACIKLTGVFDTTGETLVVRHCALDSGTLTQDTELARMSHCGKFQFEGDLLRGCVLACPEDACNSARGHLLADSIGQIHWLITWSFMWLVLGFLVANPLR